MANEATLVFETAPPIPFTVGNVTGIEKGTILGLVDRFTASGSRTYDMPVAGIAVSEKIASDGNTSLGCFRQGIFRGTASGTIVIGKGVVLCPDGNLGPVVVNDEQMVGIALESASTTETFLFELKPTTMELA